MGFDQVWHELSFSFSRVWSSLTWEVRENPILVLAAIVGLVIVWRIFSPKVKAR